MRLRCWGRATSRSDQRKRRHPLEVGCEFLPVLLQPLALGGHVDEAGQRHQEFYAVEEGSGRGGGLDVLSTSWGSHIPFQKEKLFLVLGLRLPAQGAPFNL